MESLAVRGRLGVVACLWVRLNRLVGGTAPFGVEVSSNTERLAIWGTRSKPTNQVCGHRLSHNPNQVSSWGEWWDHSNRRAEASTGRPLGVLRENFGLEHHWSL
jgi:hypothetical protein